MDDAPLHLTAGIDCTDGLHKPVQSVHAEQVNIDCTCFLPVQTYICLPRRVASHHILSLVTALNCCPMGGAACCPTASPPSSVKRCELELEQNGQGGKDTHSQHSHEPQVLRLLLHRGHNAGRNLKRTDKVKVKIQTLKKEGLNPLKREYIIDKINLRQVQKDCLISYAGNQYSVP